MLCLRKEKGGDNGYQRRNSYSYRRSRTDDYEIFSIAPVKARYVQYVGKKNTENNWNSIGEFAVFGQRE